MYVCVSLSLSPSLSLSNLLFPKDVIVTKANCFQRATTPATVVVVIIVVLIVATATGTITITKTMANNKY